MEKMKKKKLVQLCMVLLTCVLIVVLYIYINNNDQRCNIQRDYDSVPETRPRAATSRPKVATSRPKAATSRPKAATSRSKAATSRPKAATTRLMTATSRPKAATSRSKAATTRLMTATSRLMTATSRPKASINNSFHLKHELQEPKEKAPKRRCYRQIQHWLGKYGSETPQKPYVVECPGLACDARVVKDSSFETMRKSHVFIHHYHLAERMDLAAMQKRRPPNQVWVFQTMEGDQFPDVGYEHLYNYSMTFRPSSTFVRPYAHYDRSKPQVPPHSSRNWAEGKTNLIVWAASNCYNTKWRRFDFVKKLSEHIQVDIYGACGKPGCPKKSTSCHDLLDTYKFYLALENKECRDYISEKFWRTALQRHILPIAYGPPREDYERVAPPHSFIHLQDFNSMEELVDYINLVNSNDTLYNSYFEWKKHGRIKGRDLNHCEIVSRLLEDEKNSFRRKINPERNTTMVFDMWRKQCRNGSGFPHYF